MNRFSVARTTEEYIDAISIPSTWMSFTDLFFLAKCFDLRITLLELKDNGDRFLNTITYEFRDMVAHLEKML